MKKQNSVRKIAPFLYSIYVFAFLAEVVIRWFDSGLNAFG
jgi:hypothetical protein